jgi:hypothetical protein
MKQLSASFHPLLMALFLSSEALAAVGDPQLGTDHPWYPGELAMSDFARLAKTQAEQYQRSTGITPTDDHHKALAAWYFRNTHYAHGEEGKEDLWGKGFANDNLHTTRDYWTGLFAHGFALCGTTHAQWTAELDALLGHCRSRVIGTKGHNSFEAFLTGGPYGSGRWVMLDHDLSTVIFDREGKALLGLDQIVPQYQQVASRQFSPERQQGWLVCGLHEGDAASYADYRSAEYLAGYAGPPPMVNLRKGESIRRYFAPGLEDGKTFVFWGRNYQSGGIPGPERSRTWVNQPEKMLGSKTGTAHVTGQMRYGNAVYRWQPDFSEGVTSSDDQQVTLEFYTPYIIAASPPDDTAWGIYQPGCKQGLILRGALKCEVSVSTDGGANWHSAGTFSDGMDLTDQVKGHRQYHLKFGASIAELKDRGLIIQTVCQANPATFPRLKENSTAIRYEVSGRGIVSFGPNLPQAKPRVIAGAFDSPKLTLQLATPRKERIQELWVATQVASSNPPNPEIKYQIEASTDAGQSWSPILEHPSIQRSTVEPADFWSQSLWSAKLTFPVPSADTVQVRFSNNGGKRYLRAEGHLIYPVERGPAAITFAWTDSRGSHQQTETLQPGGTWNLSTGSDVSTQWVEMAHP